MTTAIFLQIVHYFFLDACFAHILPASILFTDYLPYIPYSNHQWTSFSSYKLLLSWRGHLAILKLTLVLSKSYSWSFEVNVVLYAYYLSRNLTIWTPNRSDIYCTLNGDCKRLQTRYKFLHNSNQKPMALKCRETRQNLLEQLMRQSYRHLK